MTNQSSDLHVGVALEYRFVEGDDGHFYAERHYSYQYWRDRLLPVFGEVTIFARAERRNLDSGCARVNGPGVSFIPVAVSSLIRHKLEDGLLGPDIWLVRVPGFFSQFVLHAIKRKSPYAIEIVGNPKSSIRAAVPNLLGRVASVLLSWDLKRLSRDASGVAYVSRFALEHHYPPNSNAITAEYSSVDLPRCWFKNQPPSLEAEFSAPLRLITVASLERPYKGIETILHAVSLARERDVDIRATLVGGGSLITTYEELATRLQVDGLVRFTGEIPREVVRTLLDEHDLFVLASRSEGLPRALLEAMARGLPCIATPVGGVPALLPKDAMFRVGDSDGLADLLKDVYQRPDLLAEHAARNRLLAERFSRSELQARRFEFYRRLTQLDTDA